MMPAWCLCSVIKLKWTIMGLISSAGKLPQVAEVINKQAPESRKGLSDVTALTL